MCTEIVEFLPNPQGLPNYSDGPSYQSGRRKTQDGKPEDGNTWIQQGPDEPAREGAITGFGMPNANAINDRPCQYLVNEEGVSGYVRYGISSTEPPSSVGEARGKADKFGRDITVLAARCNAVEETGSIRRGIYNSNIVKVESHIHPPLRSTRMGRLILTYSKNVLNWFK